MIKQYVEKPPIGNFFVWPVDIVDLQNNPILTKKGNIGLVFEKKAFPKLETLKSFVWDEKSIGIENTKAVKLAVNLLKQLSQLESDGYVYNSFDLEKVAYNPENLDVYLRFSLSNTTKYDDVFEKSLMLKNDICIDYLPHWNKTGFQDRYVSANQHNFSVAVLLFKMLIGRMPYQGRMFDGHGDILIAQRDNDPAMHFESMKYYLELNTFIFDKENRENSIGTFHKEELQANRWESLDKNLQRMFYETFVNSNGDNKLYTVDEWLYALNTAVTNS